jgi:uncharacterized protein GlcG (DUF336 family)
MRAVVYRTPFEVAVEEARRLRNVITEGRGKPSFVVSHEPQLNEAPGEHQTFDQRVEGYTEDHPQTRRRLIAAGGAAKGGDTMATQVTTKRVTLDSAQTMIAAARRKAEEIGVPMNIAIVDEGNNLVAFARMDRAWLGSIDIAQGKAYTARAFDMGTDALAPLSQPGQPLFGIQASNQGRIITFPGGVPLKADGTVVGAIGASGGAVEQDQQVAEAGAAAFSGKAG